MESQNQLFDQFLEDRWSGESCESKSVNTTSDLCPDYMWLNQYNPLAFNFEDLQSLNELNSSDLSTSSSPLDFALPSPISDVEDRFDQKSFIEPWVLPTAFENNTTTPAALCYSPSIATSSPREHFSAISLPSLASSPSSSESNSHSDIERDVKPIIRVRKQRSETNNSQARSPICKRQNAHNLIEKRYRNNLNSKINTLRDRIPSLRSANEDGEEDVDSDAGERRKSQKCNKGIILDKAINYIAELEKEVQRLSKENEGLQLMVKVRIPSYLTLGMRR